MEEDFRAMKGSSNFIWAVFSFIKRLTPNIVQFYKLPYNKLHGVVTRVELSAKPDYSCGLKFIDE
jgi:K+ potassium transporter C-terminal domain